MVMMIMLSNISINLIFSTASLMDDSHLGSLGSDQDEKKQYKDDLLVDIVEEESILWKRNHPSFKNQLLKEQAWLRIATQLGISSESLNFQFSIP
jgi:Alcohol dehydrogenase transcription factor Myb/SANT-like